MYRQGLFGGRGRLWLTPYRRLLLCFDAVCALGSGDGVRLSRLLFRFGSPESRLFLFFFVLRLLWHPDSLGIPLRNNPVLEPRQRSQKLASLKGLNNMAISTHAPGFFRP